MEIVTTYVPPDIISDMDDEVIHARMLGYLPADIDKTVGGFAHDFTRPAAIEKAEAMIAINESLQLGFPEWSYGVFTDLHAQSNGMKRKAAQFAETTVEITGEAGLHISSGTLLATAKVGNGQSVEFITVEDLDLDSEGHGSVLARCTITGIVGNVPENSIVLMPEPMEGISSINNPEAATGGIEVEDDAALIQRIIYKERNNETSYVGSNSDYIRWALEVDGVGAAAVIPEWMGQGTGTVKLIIMDYNGQPANETILNAVYTHIMGEDENDTARLAPVGAILTVTTAKPLEITISAKVVLEEGISLDSVKAAYLTGITAYLTEAKQEKYFRKTRAGSILSETAGIVDYENLLINGATANIAIAAEDYPTIAAVVFEEA